jgi:Ca2+-binding EF-hand superfamily protein
LLLLPLAAALAVMPAPAAPTPPAADDDAQDLVFFSDARPVLIRLHVRVDGKPYGAAWEAYVRELFNYLDRDGDGVLSKDEAARAPSGAQFQRMRKEGYTAGLGGTATYATSADLDADEDGKVTYEKFRAYYQSTGGLRLPPPINQAAAADLLTDRLFRLLDTNKDGKLSKDEVDAAEQVLRPFDEDDNELVSTSELLGGANPYGFGSAGGGMMAAPPRPGAEDKGPFALIKLDDLSERLSLADRIIKRYDKDKNGRLSRGEIGLDRDVFKELDTNKDGELDPVELMRFLRRPPDIEAVVRLGKLEARDSPTDVVAPGGKPRELAAAVRPGTAGTLLVTLGDSQIDLRRTDAVTGASDEQLKAADDARRQQYVAILKEADAEGRGYVELSDLKKSKSARSNPQLQTLFMAADRDGDGKLTEAEVEAWFDLMSKATGSYVSLAVTENGRGLFDILDANRDGSLGLRELRTAWERLRPYDRNGDGFISRDEIPRQFQLTLGLGQATAFLRTAAAPGMGQPTAVTARGPVWFRKMDRNGDGDVSLREFLGTREEFDKIDTDHDGLISVEEAERYDELIRKNQAK